jgi:hypothetical protein
MDERERAIRRKLRDDFPHYARKCLRIRGKVAVEIDGKPTKIMPFELNKAQLYLHGRLEEQRTKTGKVRALILKGRQQGCSTYVGGRYFHKTTHNKGLKTFILTHRDDATDNLFKMVRRFHETLPDLVKPSTSYSNRKELVFDLLDSSYGLGTAGSGSVGRSDTVDLFHGSEVAFWANVGDIRAGIMQAAGMAQEIILESTANGYDEMFYPMWQDAENGIGDYIAVFIPWYWQDEYTKDYDDSFRLDDEERDYQKAYGLTMGQMAWRHAKIIELKDPLLFKQEYPATAAEAFQLTGHDSYIKAEDVMNARKRNDLQAVGPHILGVDTAREGNDHTAFIHRQGRVAWGLEQEKTPDSMHIVGKIIGMLNASYNPVQKVFMDRGGEGGAIYDRLCEMGYGHKVVLVNFGSTKTLLYPEQYKNKRAEMWGLMRDWLRDDAGCSIPDSDKLQGDLTAPAYKYDSESRVVLESKEDIKKRIGRSPDGGDALGLTFAFPVPAEDYVQDFSNQPSRFA